MCACVNLCVSERLDNQLIVHSGAMIVDAPAKPYKCRNVVLESALPVGNWKKSQEYYYKLLG